MSFLDELLTKGLTAFGKIQLQTHPPLVRAIHCRQAMHHACFGDVVLRKYNCYLDGRFIPSEFSHSGIVERGEEGGHGASVIHAVAEGVERIDLLDFIKDSDGFAILTSNAKYSGQNAVQYARQAIGKPYDFHFTAECDLKGVTAFFCHELTAMSLKAGGIEIVPVVKSIGLVTHEVFLAEQFLECKALKLAYRTEF